MDKSWLNLARDDPRYFDGIDNFIEFVRLNKVDERTHPCPCRQCKLHKGWITLNQMRMHLIQYGMLRDYSPWTLHGEVDQNNFYDQGESSQGGGHFLNINPAMYEIINDTFPFRDMRSTDIMNNHVDDSIAKSAYEKYCALIKEVQKPLYDGSEKTVLERILKALKAKVKGGWSDNSFDMHLELVRDVLPTENNYPRTYRDVKKILKHLGLTYKVIHACKHGCILYYKEYGDYESCPVCHVPRYADNKGGGKVPRRTIR